MILEFRIQPLCCLPGVACHDEGQHDFEYQLQPLCCLPGVACYDEGQHDSGVSTPGSLLFTWSCLS